MAGNQVQSDKRTGNGTATQGATQRATQAGDARWPAATIKMTKQTKNKK
jgi:hypothetical protein